MSKERLYCCRCENSGTDHKMFYEVDALKTDIKETEHTKVEEIGERIIVCSSCVTFTERKEGNTLE